MSMAEFETEVRSAYRFKIPAKVRRELDLSWGDRVKVMIFKDPRENKK